MGKERDLQTGIESKAHLVEQINTYLHSGEYSRALDLLRATAADFPNDADLFELEKLARDGVNRNLEANRLITESQELFAHRKSLDAIQLLRRAYELDKNNARARAILANALVEHAISIVETEWWEAGVLSKQALELNPAHPTAKTIRSLINDLKKASPVEEWISQVSKVQASGDLFAALSLIAEGLDIHSRDSKLLLLQDAIQRDQDARRRHARRGDLEDLRRMEKEVDGAEDAASKKALAERIQALAAKYWTDGEVISVANSLLHRLGLVSQESASASPRSQRAPVIFYVPRPSAPEVLPVDISPAPPSEVEPSRATPNKLPSKIAPPVKAPTISPEPVPPAPQTAAPETSTPATKPTPPSSQPKQPARSNSTTLILVSTAAVILVGATFFFTRKHYAEPVAKTAPAAAAPIVSGPTVSAPAVSTPGVSAPAQSPEPPGPASPLSSDTAAGRVGVDQPHADQPHADELQSDQPAAESSHNLGTLLVVAGQDGAQVFLNGKLQPQLTQGGQLRLPNLELKDYVVRVSKTGFQDPPQQKIRIRKGEQARLTFNLQPQTPPQLRLASLAIQGGAPGTSVFLDQTLVGTIQPDGTLSVSTVTPGDHTVELRRDRCKPRQFKKRFIVGGTVSLAAADAALEAAPSELRITFSPPDASVAIVKGDLLKMVSSGVPLNLPAGTYTLTARTAEKITRTATFEIIAGQNKTLDLSLAPNGMSKWEMPSAWKNEKDSYIHKGGDFVLYEVAPASGTFAFSATLTKGHFLQWVLNYTDSRNYVLFQMDDNNFYRTVIRNGEKTSELIVPDKSDKKSFRTLQIRVSPNELIHQIKHGDRWIVLDRWTQPGTNLSLGKFGFYIPGNDQVALSSFAHYADLNLR